MSFLDLCVALIELPFSINSLLPQNRYVTPQLRPLVLHRVDLLPQLLLFPLSFNLLILPVLALLPHLCSSLLLNLVISSLQIFDQLPQPLNLLGLPRPHRLTPPDLLSRYLFRAPQLLDLLLQNCRLLFDSPSLLVSIVEILLEILDCLALGVSGASF